MIANKVKVGSCKIDITPKKNIELYALENRHRNSNTISSKLYVNTILTQSQKEKILFITLDLVYIGDKFCENLKKIINKKYNINEKNILINATHTRSSPLIEETVFNSGKVKKYSNPLSVISFTSPSNCSQSDFINSIPSESSLNSS